MKTSLEILSKDKEISDLIARFDRNREAYLSGDYNEMQLRQEFLDPFFAALGWDVENKQGYAEAYKDVIHEDAIKIGGATKAPDYCFRIGGARKFFVEAKKPSVNLKDEAEPAFQLRRYAWSAKLPLSILTNFEEFAVYDCREKPSQSDKASTGRTLYLRSSDYETHWEEISNIFSKEAVLKGSFDKYVETQKAKKGTAEVDEAFLQEIEGWRDMLARNIAMRNPNLTQRELNFAVQRTIDRIVFLRICEDRGIETYGALMALQDGERIYKRLCEFFYRADERYNSDLFYFQKERDRTEAPDKLTLGLEIDDKPLKDIIKNLYYPDSPYEFSVLPADILGQVYEQFLGKIIRLTSGHRAVVEDKPEVKKAGGVYYTPTYIVDYIVKNTVGKLLEGKAPEQAAKLHLLDPACGSGSFLIGAYEYLLDWHRNWYVQNGAEKWARGHSPTLHQVAKEDWRLTTNERKRILLNNIYGVDIDPQAVEVTKLSLLLKVLEGENEQTLSKQLKMFHERALPDLGNNIKCGNSLIGPDFYNGQQMSLLDEEARYRINVFDWQSEFAEIIKAGGFDAVIANPPYVEIVRIDWIDRRYYEKIYPVKGRFDLYAIFILKAMQICSNGGYWGFVIPNKFATNLQFDEIRKNILLNQKVDSILSYEGYQFKNAGVNSIVICCSKQRPNPADKVNFFSWTKGNLQNLGQQKQSMLLSVSNFNFSFVSGNKSIIKKITSNSRPYEAFFDVKDGIVAGEIKDRLFSDKRIDGNSHKLYLGKGLQRYSLVWTGKWVNYKPDEMMKLEIKRKGNKRPGLWMRDKSIFEAPKILTRKVATHLIATFDNNQVYYEQTLHGSILRKSHPDYDERYFLGILNSGLMRFYYQSSVQQKGKLFPQIRISVLKSLPMRVINFADVRDKSCHERMITLVDQMLELCKKLAVIKTAHEKTTLQRQIDATDRQIEALVYELYGLNEDEIRIIEKQE